MLTPSLFQLVFEASPIGEYLLAPDATILAVNDAFLKASSRKREDLVGKHLFEAFPENPDDPNDTGVAALRQSLDRVIATGQPDALPLQRYPIPITDAAGSKRYEERFWSAVNTPVFDRNGQLLCILHGTIDVTELIASNKNTAQATIATVQTYLGAGVLTRARVAQEINQALQAERSRLRHLFDHSPGFVYFTQGPEHVIEQANNAFYELVGTRDVIGKQLKDAFPDIAGQGFHELHDTVYRTGQRYLGHAKRVVLKKTPEAEPVECYVDLVYQPIMDANGNVIGICGQGNDITEKIRIEEELRRTATHQAFQLEMAESLRTLSEPNEVMAAASRLVGQHFNVGRVGYGEIDQEQKTVSVQYDWTNGAMSSLTAESRPLDSFGPAIIDELRKGTTLRLNDIAEDVRSAPYATGYASIGARAMIVVPLLEAHQLTAILYLHEPVPRCWTDEETALVEDVARRTWEAVKRARAEQNLRAETRVLELLNQTGQIMASTLDMQTLLQSITDTATQLSGAQFGSFFYTKNDKQGDELTLYTLSGAPREAFDQFGHPRATPLFGPTFKGQIIRSDDIIKDPRYGKWGPNQGMPKGHLPVRSYLAVRVISRSGDVFGVLLFGHAKIGVFSERTEKLIAGVAAQAAVAIDNARLYEEAQQAAQERENLLAREHAARLEAERLSQMKDEFLAMLAHELRNPLAPISAAAEVLNLMYANEPRVHKSSEIIARQAAHMKRLVDDLLDVSRVTRNLVILDKKTIDFRQVVSGALDQVQSLINQKRHHVAIQLPNEPAYVHGDETRLVQVVANILNNAAKYTAEAGNIDVKLETAQNQLQLHVKDNGSGIAPELLPDVFALFTQGASTLARSQGGLGLGLALVKKLVELHEGSVTAHSAGSGQGSEFIISLPLAASVTTGADNENTLKTDDPPNDKEAPMARLHITIIDDNADAADMLAALLRAQGHKISVYYHPDDALQKAGMEVPHAFLIDIGMPGMDGYELAQRLHMLPQLAHSQLVAVTGYGQAQDRARSKSAGFAYHLVKPVNLAALNSLIEKIALSAPS
jgi:PAS domain S-box-containing protein